jgi:alkylation response protein AidB-like acyl-CoA dehydrogenase
MCKRLLSRLKSYASTEKKRGRPLCEDPRFRNRIARVEMELLAHEWSLKRLISMEQSNKQIGIEASVLKIRGSEIQLALGQLLMECAGPYALPYVAEALEPDFSGETHGGVRLNPLASLYFDLHKVPIYGGTNEVQKNIISKSVLGI